MTNIITSITNFFTNLTTTGLCIFTVLSLLLIINTINYTKTMFNLGTFQQPNARDKCVKKTNILIIIQIILVATFLLLFTNGGIINLIINNIMTNILLLSTPILIDFISRLIGRLIWR